MPFAKVEVAVLEVMLSTVASMPFTCVEVPDTEFLNAPPDTVSPPDALMPDAERLPERSVEVPAVRDTRFPPVSVRPFDD